LVSKLDFKGNGVMANPDHVTILNQGVEAWNEWRQENHATIPDLRGVDLSKQKLDKANFSDVNFEKFKNEEKIILTASFNRSSLRNADFSRANLKRSNFSGADLSNATLDDANLFCAEMIGTTLNEATLRGSILSEAAIKVAELQSANLMQAQLIRTSLIESNLKGADLRLSDLTEACLWGTCLEGVNFTKAHVLKADLRKAKLTGACLEHWNIHGTLLEEVECEYVYLENHEGLRLPDNRNFYAGEFSRLFQVSQYHNSNRLAILEQAVIEFENFLDRNSEARESLFHVFLKNHPFLLDIYGLVKSEPRFKYPEGKRSPNNKSRLGPDFIVSYPGNRYKLVEIERPGKSIKKKRGEATYQFNQAYEQLQEWSHYIRSHSNLLEEKYPGISTNYSLMLIIGRKTDSEYLAMKSSDLIKVYTWDGLLDEAKHALKNLKALSI
jgi:uncharacterized protein YjbI with pentapeptide repeats